jgi:outer membrane immunogenic protein
MRGLLISCISVLSAVAMSAPAIADEAPAKPKRERAAAPQRAAPTQQQASNWSGGQVGGSNGVSSVNNNFVEPGAYVCPTGSTLGSTCFETPFQFSGHKAAYTIGPFVGYRVQWGNWVVGIEGDWSYKSSESSLSQSSAASIAVTGSNYVRTDQFSGSVRQKSDSSIRARVGTLVTPWSLLYVTGGVAFAEISGSFAYGGSLFLCAAGGSAGAA